MAPGFQPLKVPQSETCPALAASREKVAFTVSLFTGAAALLISSDFGVAAVRDMGAAAGAGDTTACEVAAAFLVSDDFSATRGVLATGFCGTGAATGTGDGTILDGVVGFLTSAGFSTATGALAAGFCVMGAATGAGNSLDARCAVLGASVGFAVDDFPTVLSVSTEFTAFLLFFLSILRVFLAVILPILHCI